MDEPCESCDWPPCECLEDAIDIAESLLSDAPLFSATHRIVPAHELFVLVQRLNAARNPSGHPERPPDDPTQNDTL